MTTLVLVLAAGKAIKLRRVTMRRVGRFILSCRYLLLASLALAIAGEYLFVGLPSSADPSLPQAGDVAIERPSPLRDRFEKVEEGMTESQVLEILGPPQERKEIDVLWTKVLVWQESQDSIRIWFYWGETGGVFKRFFRSQEQTAYWRKP
jgi:hypothetical protein